ncbi:MAG: serine/threonine phosphatase [Cyanobacteria bacterium P01_A01_bin.116]
MLTCPQCQFPNPPAHKFCQRCGESLVPSTTDDVAEGVAEELLAEDRLEQAEQAEKGADAVPLQARLMPSDAVELNPATFLDPAERYQVLTVLSQGNVLVKDTTPDVRSPLQQKLPDLRRLPVDALQAHLELPPEGYPYLQLSDAAPDLYDAWQQEAATLLVMPAEPPTLTSLIGAFSTATDPLQYVYWMYTLTDLWAALEEIPQWRSSLLLADNLCIDTDQSLRIRQFIAPALTPDGTLAHLPPTLSALKAFLQSLLAQPHRGRIAPLRHIREMILTVTAAQSLDQLRDELSTIGEQLLETPEAITPVVTTSAPMPDPLPQGALQGAVASGTKETEAGEITVGDAPQNTAVFRGALPHMTQRPHSGENIVENASDVPNNETPIDKLPEELPENLPETLPEESLDFDEAGFEISDFSGADFGGADFGNTTEGDELTMVLPMELNAIEDSGRTDVGRQRDHNEDCFVISSSTQKLSDNAGQHIQAHCLYVLCDGMGGHDGGEVASRLAAETLGSYFAEHWPHPLPGQSPSPLPSEATLIEAVKLANQAIFEVNEKEGRAGHERMGTTLVVVLLQGTEAVVAHVGDSRLYQHTRRVGLKQVTTDHEVGQREIKRGVPHDIAYARPDAYQLTQALGPRDSEYLQPSVSYLHFSEDTLLLLCSDGLSDNSLVEEHLKSHLDPILRGKKDLESGIDDLMDLGNQVNGHDNISAIAIRLKVSPDMGKIRGPGPADARHTLLQ